MSESWRYRDFSSTTSTPAPPPLPPPLPQHEPTALKERLDAYTPITYTQSSRNTAGNTLYKTELVLNKTPTAFVPESSTKQCYKCKLHIDLKLTADIYFNNRSYHKECFCCSICYRHLDTDPQQNFTLNYDGGPVCSKCELERAKTCTNCNRPIVAERSISFDGGYYHGSCFHCGQCRKALTDEKDLFKQNGKPYCAACFEEKFAPRCAECFKPITTTKSTIYDTKNYHPDCFRCGQCNKVMVDREFHTRNGKPCCNQCYNERFAEKCGACRKLITDGRSIIYNKESYHHDCLRCGQCNKTLADEKSCHTENSKPCCNDCHLQRFAKRCVACQRVITDAKSTIYHGDTYHPECFRCGQCNKVMREREFHTHDSKPCCDQCYYEHVAPRCAKCTVPITKEFSTFQGKNYHPYCFLCVKCKRVIGSKEKFYNDPSGFICSTCDVQQP